MNVSPAMQEALDGLCRVAHTEALLSSRAVVSYKGLSPAQLDFLIGYFQTHAQRRAEDIGVLKHFFIASPSFQDANFELLRATGDRLSAHNTLVHVVTPSTGWHVVRGYCWGTPWFGTTGHPDLDKEVTLRLGPVRSMEDVLRTCGALDDIG